MGEVSSIWDRLCPMNERHCLYWSEEGCMMIMCFIHREVTVCRRL